MKEMEKVGGMEEMEVECTLTANWLSIGGSIGVDTCREVKERFVRVVEN